MSYNYINYRRWYVRCDEESRISGRGADSLKFLAYAVNDRISNPDLRNMNIFAGV